MEPFDGLTAARQIRDRAPCSVCGRGFLLTKVGNVRRHGDPTPGVWPPRDCPGAGKPPKAEG